MWVVAQRTLREFWERPGRGESRQALTDWYRIVDKTEWRNFADVKAQFPSCDYVGNDRIVFNISGNKYRLIAKVDYAFHLVFIRFVGTHEEYDNLEASQI